MQKQCQQNKNTASAIHSERERGRQERERKRENQVFASPYLYITADGLKIVPVSNYADIEQKMEEGTQNRTVASTNMNATSR